MENLAGSQNSRDAAAATTKKRKSLAPGVVGADIEPSSFEAELQQLADKEHVEGTDLSIGCD